MYFARLKSEGARNVAETTFQLNFLKENEKEREVRADVVEEDDKLRKYIPARYHFLSGLAWSNGASAVYHGILPIPPSLGSPLLSSLPLGLSSSKTGMASLGHDGDDPWRTPDIICDDLSIAVLV